MTYRLQMVPDEPLFMIRLTNAFAGAPSRTVWMSELSLDCRNFSGSFFLVVERFEPAVPSLPKRR